MDDIDEILSELSAKIAQGVVTGKWDEAHTTQKLQALIDKKCNESRIDELERLANTKITGGGFTYKIIEIYVQNRLAELTKGGNND